MVEQDCGARATVRTRVSGTPWVCRPPQLSGAAQSKGLDVGRTNAGQSPQEQGGPRSRKDRKPSVRAPEATVPGSEIAAHDKAQPAQAWLGGAPQGARVSLWRERCAPVLPRGGIGNQDVALRGAPSPSMWSRDMRNTGAPGAGQTIRAMTHACSSSAV